jgi:hypothetical protein
VIKDRRTREDVPALPPAPTDMLLVPSKTAHPTMEEEDKELMKVKEESRVINKPLPQAVFVTDVNLDDGSEVETNSTVIKTWAVKNAGQQQWPEGTQLIVLRDDYELCSQEELSVPLAKPGETVEVSAALRVPARHGRYSIYFRLADADGNMFGARIWCDIIAVQPEVKPAVSATPPAVDPTDTMRSRATNDLDSMIALYTDLKKHVSDVEGVILKELQKELNWSP